MANPLNSFLTYTNTTGEYLNLGGLGGNNLGHMDTILTPKYDTDTDSTKIGLDSLAKMIWGSNSTAKDFINYIARLASTSDGDTVTVAQKVYKVVLTEDDAERIAYDAADFAIGIIQENYLLTDIIADSSLPDMLMEKMTGYMLHILGEEYDFSVGCMDEKPGVEDALNTICSMVDWNYIYDEVEKITHELLIRMTIGILSHVETTIKDSL